MNPYLHESIVNQYDTRLVDCFVQQNQNNEWLSVGDVTRWVFSTNKANGYQKQYCKNKLDSIMGMMWTKQIERSFLERSKRPGCEFTYVYRLKDPSIIAPVSSVKKSLEEQIDGSLSNVNHSN